MQAQTAPMAPAQAPEGIRLSIAEAEAIALRNNPRITIGKLRALVALQYVRAAQHVLEMFRRTLPNGTSRRRLDRLSNRLTKILSEARKLATP